MKKIRVGYVVAQVGQKPNSGPNVYWRNLIGNMVKNHSEDIEVVLFRAKERDDTLDLDVKEYLLPNGSFSRYLKLGSLVKEAKIDVLHMNVLPIENFLFFRYKCKKAITLHGDLAFTQPQLAKRRLYYRQKYGYKFANLTGKFNKIDLFFAVSDSVISELSNHVDIDMGKVTITHNGIDRDLFIPAKSESDIVKLKEYGLQPGSYILHINNYAEKKNALTLVRSFVEYKQHNPSAFLLIIGKRWRNEKVNNVFGNSGLKEDVDYKIIDGLPNSALPPFYRNAKVFLNPTIHETFGITNLEAMACGCPVISTNKYSIPEVVGDSALLVDDPYDVTAFANALKSVYSDHLLSETMIKKGIDRSVNFSWEATADKTAKAYLSLFKK